jgi:hypothetical protein
MRVSSIIKLSNSPVSNVVTLSLQHGVTSKQWQKPDALLMLSHV